MYGLGPEGDARRAEEPLFLVMFHNNDFGPWGCKLDELENDLSGVMHEKVHVASRRGIQQSSTPERRDHILAGAEPIYES